MNECPNSRPQRETSCNYESPAVAAPNENEGKGDDNALCSDWGLFLFATAGVCAETRATVSRLDALAAPPMKRLRPRKTTRGRGRNNLRTLPATGVSSAVSQLRLRSRSLSYSSRKQLVPDTMQTPAAPTNKATANTNLAHAVLNIAGRQTYHHISKPRPESFCPQNRERDNTRHTRT